MRIREVFIYCIISCFVCSGALRAQEERPRGIIFLSIDDVCRLALDNNLDVQIAKFDAYAKRTDLMGAESIYDTIFTAGASYTNNELKPSSSLAATKTNTRNYSAGFSKQLPTGTDISLDFDDERTSSNSSTLTVNPGHEATAKVTLKQPIGKNFFGLIDRSNIKITRLDIENSDFSSLSKIESSLADVQTAYWKVVLLYEELDIKREMLKKAEDLYDIYKGKYTIGLIENPDLLAAQANMLVRQNDVLGAIDAYNTARNNLLLLLNEDSRQIQISPKDRFDLEGETVNFEQSLKTAIENSRDYKRAKNTVESKRIGVVMKKNNLWPEIDVEASFVRNGLMGQYEKAWKEVFDEDNPQVYVGVTVKVLLENRKARGELKKAQFEKAKSLLELKKTERVILTKINDLVSRINIYLGKAITSKKVVELQAAKLAAEEKHFKYGRSSSDILIRYQDDLLSAKLAYVNSMFAYRSALIDLKLVQNTLLNKYWPEEKL